MKIKIIVVAASMFALSGCLGAVNMAHFGMKTFFDVTRAVGKVGRPSGAAAGAAALEQHMEKISKKIANMTEEEVKESMKHDTKKNLCFVFKKPRGQSERLKRIISEVVKARGLHYCTAA